MSNVTIRKVRAILTAPAGINLIVVKVETSEPNLYGLGCATFAYRENAVKSIVEEYFDPLLRGRDVADIEDLWQLMHQNSYWRNGPIIGNAVSGVDMALWDIKGKMANMPVYDLFGGKARKGVAIYKHADGRDINEVTENVQRYMEEGLRHVRVQWGGYGSKADKINTPIGANPGVYYCPDQYVKKTVQLIEGVRSKLGYDVELLHDCHERLPAIQALGLAKELEKYKLFFLEDILPPEQCQWLAQLRAQSTTPIAIGELFNNPKEWDYLIANRLIDFIRVHITQIGGLTPAKKLAVFAEQFGVRTAWHGPGDVSPLGHIANIHLDMNARNFGIQEWTPFNEATMEVFPGCPVAKNGFVYPSDAPGLGIDINEDLAAKYPVTTAPTGWTQTRIADGSLFTP